MKLIKSTHAIFSEEIKSKDKRLAEISREFDDYRLKNNLDRYFALNMTEESRERVLQNVKTLEQVTDWHYFDPSTLMQLQSANPQV